MSIPNWEVNITCTRNWSSLDWSILGNVRPLWLILLLFFDLRISKGIYGRYIVKKYIYFTYTFSNCDQTVTSFTNSGWLMTCLTWQENDNLKLEHILIWIHTLNFSYIFILYTCWVGFTVSHTSLWVNFIQKSTTRKTNSKSGVTEFDKFWEIRFTLGSLWIFHYHNLLLLLHTHKCFMLCVY